MYIPNSVQFVVSWLAIQRIGAVAVPITPIYTLLDLKYIANDTEATGIICSDRNFGYVKQAMVDTSVKRVIVTNVVDLLPWWKRAFGLLADKVPAGKVEKAPFMSSMKKMISSSLPPAPDPGTGEDDMAEILFTGGTTKHPKGVPINHGLFLVSSDEQLGVRDPLFPKDQDVILGGAPLFHILGQTCTLATIIIGGGTSGPSAKGEPGRGFRFDSADEDHEHDRSACPLSYDPGTRSGGSIRSFVAEILLFRGRCASGGSR